MDSERFPAPLYVETVLAPNFQDAQRHFLDALIEIHYAHTRMLARQGILTLEEEGTLLGALNKLDRKEIAAAVYDGSHEDLFFYIERLLEQICGPESTRVHTALDIHRVAEPFIVRKVIHQLNEGLIVIFGAGTGNPFFSTDTAAALRASEVGASMWLKATDAEGVFDSNPKTNPNAKLLKRVTHDRCIADKLEVMDQTSLTLSRERNLDICVFSMKQPGNIKRALLGEDIGTLITMAA